MRKSVFAGLAGMLVASTFTPASAAIFNVTAEAPGVQASTAVFAFSGVESFASRTSGNGQSFVTDFGTAGVVSGTYTNVDIRDADQYGAAGGSGTFASTTTTGGFSLDLTTTDPAGINYFGFWLSALDPGNVLYFYKGATLVYTFTPTDVLARVSNLYYGNPNAPFLGQNSGQPYVFLNFYDTDDTFTRIVFSEDPQVGGYESDNHTVGFFTKIGGQPIVPEPSTWALFIGGFGAIGAAMRRTRRAKAVIA